jgi:glycosyltransferase involved in cell wall biosynthesis
VYEGFGFPPLEAMRLGVPVVATAVGSVPEVVGDAALLVEPGDPDGLAGALSMALDDNALRTGLVERGRRRVRTFSWRECAEGLARLYADAAGKGSGV